MKTIMVIMILLACNICYGTKLTKLETGARPSNEIKRMYNKPLKANSAIYTKLTKIDTAPKYSGGGCHSTSTKYIGGGMYMTTSNFNRNDVKFYGSF